MNRKKRGVYIIKKFMLITFFFFLLYPKKIVNVIRLLLEFFQFTLKLINISYFFVIYSKRKKKLRRKNNTFKIATLLLGNI